VRHSLPFGGPPGRLADKYLGLPAVAWRGL
jgi:hypothetical protein